VFGSAYVDAVDGFAKTTPERLAFQNSAHESLTYAELSQRSDALALWLQECGLGAGMPVVVFGHKSPYMLVAIMACAKSGHPYVPIDVVYPPSRVAGIVSQLEDTLILDTSKDERARVDTIASLGKRIVGASEISRICERHLTDRERASLVGTDAQATLYIIFTSGSTGTPKGVEVSVECVDHFMAWLDEAYAFEGPRIWFNRAAYSFDLSVTDLVCALSHGETCFALEREAEESLGATFAALAESGMTDWVSTPSFLDQCLADDSFGPDLLPHLRRMLFVGETLRPQTVREAKRRFEGLSVYNGYGPTESCDFVSLCEITPSMLVDDRALPVGYAMAGTELVVLDPDTLVRVPDGQAGELFIVGPTVAKGYYGRPDLTQAAFRSCPAEVCGTSKSYRTGDEMVKRTDGLYYFHGRLDLQIKLHGFRIELGDIEAQLSALPEVQMAAVVPVSKDGQIQRLCACVVVREDTEPRGLKLTRQLKGQLAQSLPSYMVPTQFKYLEALPVNDNGKVDRKALVQALGR